MAWPDPSVQDYNAATPPQMVVGCRPHLHHHLHLWTTHQHQVEVGVSAGYRSQLRRRASPSHYHSLEIHLAAPPSAFDAAQVDVEQSLRAIVRVREQGLPVVV